MICTLDFTLDVDGTPLECSNPEHPKAPSGATMRKIALTPEPPIPALVIPAFESLVAFGILLLLRAGGSRRRQRGYVDENHVSDGVRGGNA